MTGTDPCGLPARLTALGWHRRGGAGLLTSVILAAIYERVIAALDCAKPVVLRESRLGSLLVGLAHMIRSMHQYR